ncbi:DUF2752 domain-containing protein [Gaoshiqia sediminis]|uniref:DUF2752 domain-containing protein n=1 Tax=Gaoshiqia sediminis TaxID=2986998 RepID=UPI003D0BFD01
MLLRESWRTKVKWGVILVSLGFIAIFYWNFNPGTTSYFPSCPFKVLTGYDCAGCGSQRAIHYLLHFDIPAAYKANALFVIAMPYLLLGAILDLIRKPIGCMLKIRKFLFGTRAIFVVLAVVITYWILRNVV